MDELSGAVARAEHLVQTGRHRDALALLAGTPAMAGADPRVWSLVTRCHIGLEEWNAALGAADRYAAAAPQDAWAPLLHSLARAGRREFREALAAADHARRMDPLLPQAHAHWAWAAAHLGSTERRQALAAAQHAVALAPNSADLHNLAGMVALQLRNKPQAEASFREALRLDPDHDEALHNLGLHEATKGRLVEAGRRFSESAQLDPTAPHALMAFQLLVNRWLFVTHITLALASIFLVPPASRDKAVWATVCVVLILVVLAGWTLSIVLRTRGRVLRSIGFAMRSSRGLTIWVGAVLLAFVLIAFALLPTPWAAAADSVTTWVLVIGVAASWFTWSRQRSR